MRVWADYEQHQGQKWLHFSDFPELKINPKQFHQDPAGIYLFPESFTPNPSWLQKAYRFEVEVPADLRMLDFQRLTDEKLTSLREAAGIEPLEPSEHSTPADQLWARLVQKFLGKPGEFNKFLRDQGYDAVFDDTGAIHTAEAQLLVLDPRKIQSIRRIDQKSSGFAETERVAEKLADLLRAAGADVTIQGPRKQRDFGGQQLQANVKAIWPNQHYTDWKVYPRYQDRKSVVPQEIQYSLRYDSAGLRSQMGYGGSIAFRDAQQGGGASWQDLDREVQTVAQKVQEKPPYVPYGERQAAAGWGGTEVTEPLYDGHPMDNPDQNIANPTMRPDPHGFVAPAEMRDGVKVISAPTDFKIKVTKKPSGPGDDLIISAVRGSEEIGTLRVYDLGHAITASDVWVDTKYRRQGIATALYVFAEKYTGKKMIPADEAAGSGFDAEDTFSEDARKLWNQPNRPFGAALKAAGSDLVNSAIKDEAGIADTDYPYYHVSSHPETPTIHRDPSRKYFDPLGIFLFLKGQDVQVLEWSDKKYRWDAKLKPGLKVWDVSAMTKSAAWELLQAAGIKTGSDAYRSLKKGTDEDEIEFDFLKEAVEDTELDTPEFEKAFDEHYFSPGYAADAAYRILRAHFQDRDRFTAFLKQQGFEGVEAESTIYAGEPQLIVFDPAQIIWLPREENSREKKEERDVYQLRGGFEDEGWVGKHWGSQASGILFRAADQILLLKRAGWVDRPGTWGIPGGAVPVSETGEPMDPKASAFKETEEEIGGIPPHQDAGQPVVFRDGKFRYQTYPVRVDHEFAPLLNNEHVDFQWIGTDEALKLPDLHPGVRWMLERGGSAIKKTQSAAPPPAMRQQKFYHGTKTEEAAQKIWAQGIRPDLSTTPETNVSRPVEGRVYLATHPKESIPYLLGGAYGGHELPDRDLSRDGQYGYLFVVDGKSLADIQPDEDQVGQAVHDRAFPWLDQHLPTLREEFPEGVDDYDEERRQYADLLAQVDSGEYDGWIKAGHILLPHLTDQEKIAIIKRYGNVANEGRVMPVEMWRFDKVKSPLLRSNGSNFFELATLVKKRSPRQASNLLDFVHSRVQDRIGR